MCSAVCCAVSISSSASTTDAPSRANASAIAAPMPRPAPVTSVDFAGEPFHFFAPARAIRKPLMNAFACEAVTAAL